MSDAKSAIERVPVEVWQLIFQYACVSPYSPFIDERHQHLSPSITQNHHLFEFEWREARAYKEFDTIFKTLRSVCRSWKAVVDTDVRGRYIYTNLEDFAFPIPYMEVLSKVETMHLIGPYLDGYCFCSRINCSWIGKCVYHTRQLQSLDKKWWDVDMTSLQRKLENVKIVFLRDNSRTSQRVLKAARNIRALYWDQYFLHSSSIPFPPTRASFLPVLLNLQEMKFLTHLSLNGLEYGEFSDDYINGDLVFRSVQYLHIAFSPSGRASPSPPKSRNNVWPFPKLRTLKVRGEIQMVHRNAVLDFFRTCGKTVTEFVEDSASTPNESIPKAFPQLSLYFPNLLLYGIGIHEFLRHRIHLAELATLSYASKGPSFTLLIYDLLRTFWRYGEQCIETMRIIRARWKIPRIMMYDTWNELEDHLKEHPKSILQLRLDSLKTFFAVLGPPRQFCDREGISLHDATFQQDKHWIEYLRGGESS